MMVLFDFTNELSTLGHLYLLYEYKKLVQNIISGLIVSFVL